MNGSVIPMLEMIADICEDLRNDLGDLQARIDQLLREEAARWLDAQCASKTKQE